MTITRKPIFWFSFAILSIASLIFTIKFFSTAFPIVNLDITCNRTQALEKAAQISKEYKLGPANYSQAATFQVDQEVKTFVELEAGGKEAFTQMLKDRYYAPYLWKICLFKEFEKNEIFIYLKPDGTPYGFSEVLSENEPGKALPQDEARAIAEKNAPAWQVNLAEYKLIEQSKETSISGRINHHFVYERPDIRIGKGYYRVQFTISGDKLTAVYHFVKIPEEFSLKYSEMRSANNSIATAARVAKMLLYILGCCIIGLFVFVRRKRIIWRTPLFWGIFVAFLDLLVSINQFPLLWMSYPTALSMQGFLLKELIDMIYQFLYMSAFYSISFMAAENLTRAAFGDHIQLWKSWSRPVASSYAMLGRTIGGYLMVPLELAFCVAFYIITTRYFGWWFPSEALIDPNVLAHYFPWLSSIVESFGAGFMEECLFRAVPLASAALLGDRLGNRRLWLIIGFIVQALIFGAAHANYAAQPAYVRIVELFFFSIIYGLIYLRFGLIPVIISHFTYDVVWFALPLFVSSAPGSWINQSLIILLTIIPLLIILYRRLKSKSFRMLSNEYKNAAWQPQTNVQEDTKHTHIAIAPITLKKYIKPLILASGIAGLCLWFATVKYHQDAPALSVTMNQAVTIANKALVENNITLKPTWQPIPAIGETDDELLQRQWVWQKGGKDLYHKYLGTYLYPPLIVVRYATFDPEVSIIDRSLKYYVFITKDGEVMQLIQLLPETQAGPSLEENQARAIAHVALKTKFNLDAAKLKEISALAEQKPERKDWTFIFVHNADYPLSEGQARVVIDIAGNIVTNAYKAIHVPETWERSEHNRKNLLNAIELVCSLLLYILFWFGFIIVFIRKFNRSLISKALLYFVGYFILYIVSRINEWPITLSALNTSEPFYHQIFMYYSHDAIEFFKGAASFSLILAGINSWRLPYKALNNATYLYGINLGVCIAGIYALIQKLAPSLEPIWAKYQALGSYLPWLYVITDTILNYIPLICNIMLLYIIIDLITNHWRRRKVLGYLLFIFGGILINSSLHSIENILFWIISGTIIGIIFAGIYISIARYDRTIVPIMTGTFIISLLAQQIIFNAYPHAILGNVVGIIIVILLSYAWAHKLQQHERDTNDINV